MKKLKANSILAAFIFGTSLLMLTAFGTDACYVILSRYKLQKITESVAIEYAASKARDYENNIETEAEKNESCRKIRQRYEAIYNVMGSGVLVFNIEDMKYKANRVNQEIAVKVSATSRVLPVFLRFVGVREIHIHATASAKTNRLSVSKDIKSNEGFGFGSFVSGKYANANSDETMVNFSVNNANNQNDFTETYPSPYTINGKQYREKTADMITTKNTGIGDFMIKFGYKPRASWWGSSDIDMEAGGGFFVVGGYRVYDSTGSSVVKWVDIGNKALNKQNSELKRICVDPGSEWANYEENTTFSTDVQCFYCIDAAKEGTIIFDLSKDISGTRDTGGRITRLTDVRVYKAGGSGETKSGSSENENPCNPEFTQKQSSGGFFTPFFKYFNREAVIKLTILNNVSLIKNSEYENFPSKANGFDDDISGFCPANR